MTAIAQLTIKSPRGSAEVQNAASMKGLPVSLIAAIVMPISSLSALAVSLKSRTFADLRESARVSASHQPGSRP